MTATLFPAPEGVVTCGGARISVDKVRRQVVFTTKGAKPVSMLAEDARAFAVGVMMAVRRIEER